MFCNLELQYMFLEGNKQNDSTFKYTAVYDVTRLAGLILNSVVEDYLATLAITRVFVAKSAVLLALD